MNYEEKYKEALERASKLRVQNPFDTVGQMVEHIFPELKESEDERIRKGLIKAVSFMLKGGVLKDTDVTREEALAWLEKQGEHKSYGQRKECEDCQFNYAGECKGYCDLKRNEHKPTDKVEPKFKVYDWITGIDDEGEVFTYRIVEFCGDKVRLVDLDEYFTLYPKSELNNYRLWTINDAKDGDLIYVSTETKGFHAIFHKFENGIIYFHCNLCGDFAQGGYEPSGDVKSVTPLLKEHYRRFFQKMKQAGYEWNAEKKELKKMKVASKESEDEKIKRELRNDLLLYVPTPERYIAWLEKQKHIINVPPREVILSIWDLGNEWKELTNGCISTEYGTQLDYIQKHWHESEYYLKEKQGKKHSSIDINKMVDEFAHTEVKGYGIPSMIEVDAYRKGINDAVKEAGDQYSVDFDGYKKVAYGLSSAFMDYLDNIRPEGKMCLSNMECADIEKAFLEMDWAKLYRYLKNFSKEGSGFEEEDEL